MERKVGVNNAARVGALVVLTLLVGLVLPSKAFAEYAQPYPYGSGVNVNVNGGYARPAYPYSGYNGGVGVGVGVAVGGTHGINTYGPLRAGVAGAQRMRMGYGGGRPVYNGGCHRGCGRRCGGRGFRSFSISITIGGCGGCGGGGIGFFGRRGGCGGCGHGLFGGRLFHRC